MEKVFSYIVLFLATLNREKYDPDLITFLAILKVRKPEIFELLREGAIDSSELLDKLELPKFRKVNDPNNDFQWLRGQFQYLLNADVSEELPDYKVYQQMFGRHLRSSTDKWRNLYHICNRFESFNFTSIEKTPK